MNGLRILLGALLMTVSITHQKVSVTPPDPAYEITTTDWNNTHTVAGLATVAESGAYSDLSGSPVLAAVATSGAYADLSGSPVIPSLSDAWPIGSIYISSRSTSPAVLLGFGTWTALEAQFLVGVKAGDPDFGAGASGGATGVAAVGSVSKPTFVGDNYTPSGTNSTVNFTPSGTIDMTLYIPKGTNSTSSFTASGSVSFPVTVPTFAGTAVQATSSVNWPTGVATFAGTASGATVSASVNWPTGVPSFAGVVHRHELPIIHTDNTVLRFLPTGTFGAGAVSRVPDVRVTVTSVLVADVTNSGVVMLSNTATASGVISWPASVPQAIGSSSAAGIISWPASVPQAIASSSAAGIITWPSGVPSFTGFAGTIPAQTFGGTAGSGSAVFTGIATVLAAATFTGVAKAATGTVSQPTFAGDKTSVLPPFRAAYMWERTA